MDCCSLEDNFLAIIVSDFSPWWSFWERVLDAFNWFFTSIITFIFISGSFLIEKKLSNYENFLRSHEKSNCTIYLDLSHQITQSSHSYTSRDASLAMAIRGSKHNNMQYFLAIAWLLVHFKVQFIHLLLMLSCFECIFMNWMSFILKSQNALFYTWFFVNNNFYFSRIKFFQYYLYCHEVLNF